MDAVEFKVLEKQGDKYKLFCESYKACNRINKAYPQYKQDNGKLYRFQEGEEGIFFIPSEFYKKALKILKATKCLY